MLGSRLLVAASGALIAILVLSSTVYLDLDVQSELQSLSVVAGLVLSSYLIGEALGIVPAILEIILGFMAGLLGVEVTGTIDVLALMGSVLLMFAAGR